MNSSYQKTKELDTLKLLVTGGCGFIGSNFVRMMLQRDPDCEITNIDKLTYAGNPENLKDIQDNPNYSFIKGGHL